MNNSSQVADKFIFPEDLKQQRIAHKQLNNSISHLLKSQKHKKPNLNYLNILLRFKECCDSRYQAEIHFWTEEYEKRFLNLPSNPLIERIKKEALKCGIRCENYGFSLMNLWKDRGSLVNLEKSEISQQLQQKINTRIITYTTHLVLELLDYRTLCNEWHKKEIEFWEVTLVNLGFIQLKKAIGSKYDKVFVLNQDKSKKRRSKILSMFWFSEPSESKLFKRSQSDAGVFISYEKPPHPYKARKSVTPSYHDMSHSQIARQTSIIPNQHLTLIPGQPTVSEFEDEIERSFSLNSYSVSSSQSASTKGKSFLRRRILGLDQFLPLEAENASSSVLKRAWIQAFDSYKLELENDLVYIRKNDPNYLSTRSEISQISQLINLLSKIPEDVQHSNDVQDTSPHKVFDRVYAKNVRLEAELKEHKLQLEQIQVELQSQKIQNIEMITTTKKLATQTSTVTDLYICINSYHPSLPKHIQLEVGNIVKVKMMFIDGTCHGHNLGNGEEGIIPMKYLKQTTFISEDSLPDSPTMKSLQQQFELQSSLKLSSSNSNWDILRNNYHTAVAKELGGTAYHEWTRKIKIKTFWHMIAKNYAVD